MRVLITGAGGQLGRALKASAPRGADVLALSHLECDICNPHAIRGHVLSLHPQLIFNAAAYTAVDRAESEPEVALRINGTAVGQLAQIASEAGARFVHVSSDYVFDGASGRPYGVEDVPNPINAYGRTKLAGEKAALKAADDVLVVRSAWVYSFEGHNFVRSMLRLMAAGQEVRVVCDQVGTPTYAVFLAGALWQLAERGAKGLFHYTETGHASWYEFALAIQEEALLQGLLKQRATIVPIATADYPTVARRPSYTVLDNHKTWAALGQTAPHWRSGLREMLRKMPLDD